MDKNVSTYKNGRLIRKSVIAPLLLLVVTFNLQLFAQKQNPEELSDFSDMSLEQLMDVPINTAASRLPYETGELSDIGRLQMFSTRSSRLRTILTGPRPGAVTLN